MEMSTVFGKPLGKLTGAEGRQLDGWQSEVFKDVCDADVLDNVKTEEEAHAIHDRWVLGSSRADRRCDRCGKPIEAAKILPQQPKRHGDLLQLFLRCFGPPR